MSLCHARGAQANHKDFFLILPIKLFFMSSSYMAYFAGRIKGNIRAKSCSKHCKKVAARAMLCKTNVLSYLLKTEGQLSIKPKKDE